MTIPGYDPDDLNDALETRLEERDVERHLSDEEREAYRRGDADLVDLLDEDEIERLLDRDDGAE